MAKKKSKLKKFLIGMLILFILAVTVLSSQIFLFYIGTFKNLSSTKFDETKLTYVNSEIETYDLNDKLIENSAQTSRQLITNSNLNQYTKDAFISIEDKQFYKHKGINYKRIVKAILNNIKTMSAKEGASTISQQLIKNTHLTNEKTLKRKINELLLTQNLEEKFTKDEILQAYLNVIYFGSGTFGLQQASQKYFSKDATMLSLSESATLAGIIKSPKKYSPINNPNECKKRRNIVLSEMYKDKKISEEEYKNAINENLNLNINSKATGNNTYINAAVSEACEILNISEKDLVLDNYRIYTYLDSETQTKIEEILENKNINPLTEKNDSLGIIIDNSTGGISAYYGKSKFNLQEIKRQPGSALKPILVYTPALEKNIITPSTPILDEKFSIDGYTPSNYKDKYLGWTNVKTSLAKSLNIPSVKILNYLGIENAKNFAKKIGIKLSEKDNGYSIALGGLTDGITPLELANSYQTVANLGKYKKATFIRKIVNKYGRIVYENDAYYKTIIREDTAYLLTTMLKEAVNSGTSKKLSDLPFEIAAKTGTVGDEGQKNTDVWNLSYSPDHTVCIWLGNTDENKENNISQNITGASYPTQIAKEIYKNLEPKTKKFKMPESVVVLPISEIDLQKNNLMLADENTPERYKIYEYFSKYNIPKEKSTLFTEIPNFQVETKNNTENTVTISFVPEKYYHYNIIIKAKNDETILATYSNKKDKISFTTKIPTDTICEFFVVAKTDNKPYQTLQTWQYKKSDSHKYYISSISESHIL